MPYVQFNPLVRGQESLRAVGSRGPALKQLASKGAHDRPLLVAGSLLALGLIPVAAYASKRAFGRPHTAEAPEMALPRNMEWYAED